MKFILLLPLLTVVSLAEKYDPINKTSSIDQENFGTQAAKDIRAIGRSYAYQLIKKEKFTDYVGEVKKILDDNSLEDMDKAKKYAEDYTVHIAVVGAGIIIAILLFLGFLFTPLCCCCCNKSQKQDSGMAMWRMIWGAILVILLAANIAGLAILAVSGQQLLTLEDDTTNTIDKLGDGFANYLDETDKQIDTMRSNQLKAFVENLKPLFDTAIKDTVTDLKKTETDGSPGPATKNVNTMEAFLKEMNTVLVEAETNVGTLYTTVGSLETTVKTINDNLKICQDAATECDNAHSNACTDAKIGPDKFAQPFETKILEKGKIEKVKVKLDKMKTFPATDGKTLEGWATEVRSQWDNLQKTVEENKSIKEAKESYEKVLTDAEKEVNTKLEDDVQSKLKEFKGNIEKNKTEINTQLKANLAYLKKVMLLQEGDKENVWKDLVDGTEDGIGKYIPFALFVLISVILGLLVLTVVVGLLATVFGCCRVSDDVLPTERDSGACGNLLMCTSYCSVILCAIACLVAAILVTVVIATEGTCKQYADEALPSDLKKLGEDLNMDLDIGKLLKEALKLQDTVELQVLLESCKNNETFVNAFNIGKDTQILDQFSFNSLKEDVEKQINEFDVANSLSNFNTLIPTDVKTELKTNVVVIKDDNLNYDDIKQKITTTKIKSDKMNMDNVETELNKATFAEIQPCKDAFPKIKTNYANTATQKIAVVNALDAMKPTADKFDVSAAKVQSDLLDPIAAVETSVNDTVKAQAAKTKNSALALVETFMDWTFDQFNDSIASCQPVWSTYKTVMNYTCDGVLIHLTLIYCGMSLVGISLLFYMCVARCLARYFIKFGQLHPEDEGGNGWTKDHSMTPVLGSGNRVGPYPGHYAQTKL